MHICYIWALLFWPVGDGHASSKWFWSCSSCSLCRASMSIATATLAGAGVLFFIGAWVSHRYPDYRKEDEHVEEPDAEESRSQHAALLSNGNDSVDHEHL